MIEHIPTAQAGHFQIDDCHVEGLLLDRIEGRLSVFTNDNLVPHPGQLGLHHLANNIVVIDEQNLKAVLCW